MIRKSQIKTFCIANCNGWRKLVWKVGNDSMESPSLMQAFGLIGVVGYISCFASLQLGLIDGNGRFFAMMSVVNASLVLVSLMEQFNLPAAIIQISWITFGSIGLTLKTIKLSENGNDRTRFD